MKLKRIILGLLGLLVMNFTGFAQDDDFFADFEENIYDLSLEELFNVNVSSVSKKSESLFEAPLSASVVSHEEIENAGCTSIPEALRLVPGVIVREQTNGIYEIFIRGGENTIDGSFLPYMANSNTLVMIDGRPVYNYLQGGTFWETFPIDLNDVERIEVVRGAMSALYGPNAVSGVINIITKRPKNYTFYSNANAQIGTNNTKIANGSFGYKWNQKVDAVISGNFQQRDRYQNDYYVYSRNEYIADLNQIDAVFGAPIDDDLMRARLPEPSLAMEKYGINAFVNFNPADKIKFSVATGLQDSRVQKAYSENTATPFSTSDSKTSYFDLRTNIHNLSGQVSWLDGKQSPALQTFGLTYDVSTLDAFFEYDFIIGSQKDQASSGSNFGEFEVGFLPENHSISFRPGFNYRQAIYDDTPYWENGEGFINDEGKLNTTAISMKFDYDIKQKFRFTTALRNDQHNFPSDKNFLSYQFSLKYQLNENHIFRGTYSRAYRGVYVLDTYSNFNIYAEFPKDHYFFTGNGPADPNLLTRTIAALEAGGVSPQMAPVLANAMWDKADYNFEFSGNRDLDLLKNDMFELGYRSRISKHISFDLEAFHSRMDGFVYPIIQQQMLIRDTIGVFQPDPVNLPSMFLPVMQAQLYVQNYNTNFPQQFVQQGATLSVNYLTKNLQIKPYVTLQQSKIEDYTDRPEVPEYDSLYTKDHHATPDLFGGAYINYQASTKLNINFNAYYMGSSTILHDFGALRPPLSDGELEEGTGIDHISTKFILNGAVSYKLNKHLRFYLSGRNILAAKTREYFFTDRINSTYLVGLNFTY
ncbi:MAG: TonB-dependent receptor plug domain-containing protein [Candidatus Cyclobacteriaceae bacterium M3_2C_046]